ncbi:hypothetical protein [Intrasporangium sp. YIM S08009]|uniref:hypothetical protein n=1 Tax=Intrasporangium zincisolvens TaxID=3080018 RepID=UPI002B05AD57|nr:hypothetical protein [Intrasporangium sp. YIM S08009]
MRTSKFQMKKKTAVILTSGVLTVAAAGGAVAYWSTTGDGTGTATNATANGTIVLHASFADGLTPGASETVSYTADNAGTSSLRVGTISAVVSTDKSGCLASDFTIGNVVSNTTVPAKANGFAVGSGTLAFADTDANQDACKGAKITLTLTSN